VSYVVGQQAQLSTTVQVDGVPTNATMALVVTKPDGTSVSPTIGTTGTGQYEALVTVDQPSVWTYVWTSSGAAVGSDRGSFYVRASGARIISLRELKQHLNKDLDSTEDDEELANFIDAAQDMIVAEYGPILPTIYSEVHAGWDHVILLNHRPVLSITSVSESFDSGAPIPVSGSGYDLDKPTGLLRRFSAPGVPALWAGAYQGVQVVYVAGQDPVSQKVRLAAMELAAHLWRNTQVGRARRTRAGAEDEGAAVGLGYSMPYRVRELLGRKKGWVL